MNIRFDDNVGGEKPKFNSIYILILVGMLLISILSLVLTFRTYNKYSEEAFNEYAKVTNNKQENNATPVESNEEIIHKEPVEMVEDIDENTEVSAEIEEEITIPTVAKVEPIKKEEVLQFVKPVNGSITKESSIDEVVYWDTLDVWKIHEGIDIGADIGTNVKCIESGKITSVKTDPIFGKLIIVNHGQGMVSIYCNLEDKVFVKEGDTVRKNEIIGKVGETAYGEIEDEPHLHFELMRDSAYVDPEEYISFD